MLILVGACGGRETAPVFTLSSVVVSAEENANDNRPTPLDLVIVYDVAMIEVLSTLPAAEWFARRDQFRRDFENGFVTMSWEMVPNHRLPPIRVPEALLEGPDGTPAHAGFLFARYAAPGEHRARLEPRSGLKVVLGRDSFTVESFDVEP